MSRLSAYAMMLGCAASLLVPGLSRADEQYALLVGVRHYPTSKLRSLNYTEADIAGMAETLHDAGYRSENVILMTQTVGEENRRFLPAYANIRNELRLLLKRCGPTDTVLIALAGHGVQFRGSDEPYFCPMDANLNDKTTLIGLKEVYQELAQCRARIRLLIDESCRNDPLAEQSGALQRRDLERLVWREDDRLLGGPATLVRCRAEQQGQPRKRPEVDLESVTRPQGKLPPRGVAAFFSCSAGQRDYESDRLRHGVFFNFVIEALQGKADTGGDREVTLEELVSYTAKRVKSFVRKEYQEEQVPYFCGEAPAGLVVVKLSDRKGASLGVAFQDLDARLAKRLELQRPTGVQVEGVLPGLAGARAGLRQDDVLLKLDEAAIPDRQHLKAMLARLREGDRVTLEVLRSGDRLSVKVELGAKLPREELARLYEQEARRGEAWAQYELGRKYALGDGVGMDDREAVRWFRRAAQHGMPAAQYMLAVRYASGQGVAQDYAEAFQWYLRAAEKGHANAQFTVGLMYQNGLGVEKDEEESVKWYRQAAEQGDPPAQCKLGACYEWGRGVMKDYEEAVKWYRQAAERGTPQAQRSLGFMYRNGLGVEKDPVEAVRWYHQAAERGDLYALDNLGNLYLNGVGVKKDYQEAAHCYRQAADRGLPEAQLHLGLIYLKGLGMDKDPEQAARWLRQAADNESPLAQRFLGMMYEAGLGVEKDRDEAVKWYRRAADNGDGAARKRLEQLMPD